MTKLKQHLTWQNIVPVIALVVAGLLAYGQMLQAYFATDEWWAFSFAIAHPNWRDVIMPTGVYAPSANLFIAFLYRAFGVNPVPWAVFALTFHALNTLLIYWLIWRLTEKKSIGLVTAVVFAIAPMGSQFIHQLSMMPTSGAATVLGLGGLVAYSYRKTILAAILIFIALSFAPYAVPFIIFAALIELAYVTRKKWWRSLTAYLPVGVIFAIYYAVIHFVSLRSEKLNDRPVISSESPLEHIFYLIRKMYQSYGEIIYNLPNQIDSDLMVKAAHWVTAGTVAVVSVLIWRKQYRLALMTTLGFLWIPASVALFSTLNTVALDATFPSRYFYLTSIGVGLLLGSAFVGLTQALSKWRWAEILAVALLTAGFVFSYLPKTRQIVAGEVVLGNDRRMIMETVTASVPTVRRDAIFCFTSNEGHYMTNPDVIPLPFIHNFGFNLAVHYRSDEPELGLFNESPYFVAPSSSFYWHLKDANDPDGFGPGIGWATNLETCKALKQRFDFVAIDDFYAFAYDGTKPELRDITPAVRRYLKGEDVPTVQLYPWQQ